MTYPNSDVLKPVLLHVEDQLQELIAQDQLGLILETSFGWSRESVLAEEVENALLREFFLDDIELEVLPSTTLEGSLGAYAGSTNQIFLSDTFVLRNTDSPEIITDVVLEEIGHAIDAQFNAEDSAGDEGSIFSALVQGKSLSPEQLEQLYLEDDTATITVDGQEIVVEQATITVDDDGSGDYTTIAAAISAASAGDIIVVTGGGDNLHTEADITINKALTIQGDADVTIDANSTGRVFNIDDGTGSAIAVNLEGLTLTNGATSGTEDGGAILNQEDLTIDQSTISNSTAADDGGAIANFGTLTLNESTLSNNTSSDTSSPTSGGGGLLNTKDATATIVNSTLSGNSALNGGAIRNDGVLSLVNSTLSGNTATNGGGGIAITRDPNDPSNPSYQGTAYITNSTITDNDVSGSTYGGGGIGNVGTLSLTNSIVAGNVDNDDIQDSVTVLDPNTFQQVTVNGTNIDGGHNLIGNGDNADNGGVFVDGNNGNLIGTSASPINANFDPNGLQDNGGSTLTIALQSNSPAIDAGNENNLPTEQELGVDVDGDGTIENNTISIDQRGLTRTFDFDPSDSDGLNLDMGAVENECFLTGTLIATEDGKKAVETLEIGDKVQTADGSFEAVKWIGIQTYYKAFATPFRSHPVLIKAGALGEGIPKRDLYTSPDHALYLEEGILANAGALMNGVSIIQIEPEEEKFYYYHVELDRHALLLAEGALAESYLAQGDRLMYDNGDEYAGLYPEETARLPLSYPRASSKRQVPRYIKQRLATRAEAMFGKSEPLIN
ncbi:MAG: Hint domain-containing protein [Halothece sp. Uz-M2-17]|nr:Hint domain-containing protein [Halothece sp. Uz-M2-17]